MNGSDHSSGLRRFAAPAALTASAALFLTALTGIASIDPGAASAGSAAPLPAVHDVSLDQPDRRSSERRDCPWRHKDATPRDVRS